MELIELFLIDKVFNIEYTSEYTSESIITPLSTFGSV